MEKRKKIIKIILPLCLLIIYLFSAIITANAAVCDKSCTTKHTPSDKLCPLCAHEHQYSSLNTATEVSLYSMACTAYGDVVSGKVPVDDGSGASTMDKFSVESLLAFDVKTTYSPVMNVAESVYNALSFLGCIIVFVYFLLELVDQEMDDGLTYETLARYALKTLIAFMIIRNGFTIIMMGMNEASKIFTTLAAGTSGTSVALFTCSSCPFNTISGVNGNFIEAIGLYVSYLLPYLTMLIAKLIVRVICWARMVDVTVRIMLAPIGMADLAKDGMKSNGMRYFKKLLASALQGACILGVMAAYRAIAANISGSLAGFVGAIVTALALITTLKKTTSIAEDIIGH